MSPVPPIATIFIIVSFILGCSANRHKAPIDQVAADFLFQRVPLRLAASRPERVLLSDFAARISHAPGCGFFLAVRQDRFAEFPVCGRLRELAYEPPGRM